jgi:Actin like proteins N terminal domain
MTTTYFDTHDGHATPLTAQTRLTQVVDPGNRFTKWLEGKAPRSIPSYIKQLADWEDGEPDSHSYIATLDGKRYAIGRLAQELGGKPAFEEGKADLAHLLVLPAIASNGCPLRIENLVIPTPDIRNRAVIQQLKKLENTLDFTLNGVDQVISIRQVRTVDECRGAYLLAKAQKLWKFPAHTNGVIDFGGGTAIARLFTPSGVLIREADVVLPGTYALAQKLAAALLPVLGQTPDLGLLMDAIAEGVYLYGTSGVNFAEQFRSVQQGWINEIRNKLKLAWNSHMNNLGEVLVVGGSAPLLTPLCDASKGRFKIAPQPQFFSLYGLTLESQNGSPTNSRGA